MTVEVKWPALQEPNDGFDENDRWLGMTPEELDAWLEEVLQRMYLLQWETDHDPS